MLQENYLSVKLTGGVGKAINLLSVKQVDKMTIKTRSFQEASEFLQVHNVDRSMREIKELIRQEEANCEFTNSKRETIDLSPNDLATESFHKAEKESGFSPLSQLVAQLRLRAQQRSDSMVESSVLMGAKSSVFTSRLSEIPEDEVDVEESKAIFSSSEFPTKKSKVTKEKPKASKKRHHEEYEVEGDEDLVENLVLSSNGGEIQDKV